MSTPGRLSLSCLALVACGGSVEAVGASSGGGSTSTASGAASSVGSSSGASMPAVASASSSTSGASTSGGGGTPCSALPGATCPKGSYCDYTPSTCGLQDASGVCTPMPEVCPELYQPTCGCDHVVHASACAANGAGVDIDNVGTCAAPAPNLFPCGARFCDRQKEYCTATASDVAGADDSYGCSPLPAGCGPMPSCGCLQTNACFGTCKGDAGTGLTLSCAGG